MSTRTVLHVQKSAGIGGCERHLLDLLPALRERGTDARFLLLHAPGGERYARALEERGIEVTSLPAGPDVNPALVARIAREVRRGGEHIVHTHLVHADVHGQLAAALTRRPSVSSIHGTHSFYGREPTRSAARMAGHLATRTIAISQFAAQHVRTHRIAAASRLRVVPYGLDVASWAVTAHQRTIGRAHHGIAPNECAVVIASRLIPGKGHRLLIEAACAVAHEVGLRVLIAGDGPERTDLETLARTLDPHNGRITFLGFVDDVRGLLAAADAVAFTTQPELSEGFGLAALEAQAAGLPVVATGIASLPEIVVAGETGLLVPPHDVAALRAALVQLAQDQGARLAMGRAGAARARAQYSLERMVDGTLAVYDEVGTRRSTHG